MPHDSEGSRGFRRYSPVLKKKKRLEVLGGKLQFFQDSLSAVGLQHAELELLVGIPVHHKIDPGVAPITDPIEHDEPLVPRPLM